MNNHPSLRLLLVLAASSLVVVACSTEPAEPLIRTPGDGSIFMFTNYVTDSTGEKIAASENQSTRVIINTNATVAGETGVVQFLESGDTASMKYEANGDVKMYQPGMTFPNEDFPAPAGLPIPSITVPGRWAMFALGSRTQQTVPGYDTTITVSLPGTPFPVPVTVNATGTTEYIGTEDLVVASETIATQKALLRVNVNFTALIVNGSFRTVDTLWFAPKLGMFIKDEMVSTRQLPEQFGGNGRTNGRASVMTGYAMK